MTDDELLCEHDANVQQVSHAVAGLVQKFAPHGMTPMAVFEGSLKGAVMAMLAYQQESPEAIALLLEDAADAVRRIETAKGPLQ